jgi:hypothetical protein
MKIVEILIHRWRPKLTCLVLAGGLWYVIKQNVKQAPAPKAWPDPAAATQSRK